VVGVVGVMVSGLLGGCSSAGASGGGRSAAAYRAEARSSAVAFLHRYVMPDGRVARFDQGGDTVSEGQSYGLLLAEVAGEPAEVRLIWSWTRAHLQRPDGLLAFHADPAGRVIDRSSATDADLVTAWGLARSGDAALRSAGIAMARAVLDRETTTLPDGALLLSAGDWATGRPASLNPSYWVFPALTALSRADPDGRWAAVSSSARRALATLTLDGTALPPDWARADGDRLSPTPAPNGQAPRVQYSFDAQRCLVWLAAARRDGAAGYTALLGRASDSTAQSLDPDGRVLVANRSAVAAVAAAAAADAAGSAGARDRLLATAAGIEQRTPTYYGAAWVALGRALLTTDLLTGSAA
jgi:endoglucanase